MRRTASPTLLCVSDGVQYRVRSFRMTAHVATGVAALIGQPGLLTLGATPTPPTDPPYIVAEMWCLVDWVRRRPDLLLTEGLLDVIDWWRTAEAMWARSGHVHNA